MEYTNESQIRIYSGRLDEVISDASPEGIRKIEENLNRVMKMQKDYWKWKNSQINIGALN